MDETVYEHVNGRDTFTVTAAERWSIRMIKKLAEQYSEVVIVHENPDGSLVAHVPLSWMKIAPKRKRNMTDEQRAACSERMAKMREARRRDETEDEDDEED